MKQSRRWISVSTLTITLVVVVGLSSGSIALAQEEIWGSLVLKVDALYNQGKYSEAATLAKLVLKNFEQKFAPDHPLVGLIRNKLAEIYRAQGKEDEAKKLLARAKEAPVGSTASAQVGRWSALALQTSMLVQQKKYREALPIAKETLKVAEGTFGPDHAGVGGSLGQLGAVYLNIGQYAKAELLLKRALPILEKAWGSDDPRVAVFRNVLAIAYRSQGKEDEAKKLLARE